MNTALLHNGTPLSQHVLKHELRDLAYQIIDSAIQILFPQGERPLTDVARDVLFDLELISENQRLSRHRALEMLRFWQQFHKLAESLETEEVEVQKLPV